MTDEQLSAPDAEPLAQYWVSEAALQRALGGMWDRGWLFGWRDIAGASNVRTFIPSALPLTAVAHVFLLAYCAEPADAPLLQGVWSSLAFDYISRQKQSGAHMTYFAVKQLACPEPAAFEAVPVWADTRLSAFVRVRVLELAYTSWRLAPYAVDVLEGTPGETDVGPPFRWLPERRAHLRAEVDAAMLHLYGLSRDDAEHVLDSFFVLRKYEERDQGEFTTKRLVLTEYDRMADAAVSGIAYRSPLSPPPGSGPRHANAASSLAGDS